MINRLIKKIKIRINCNSVLRHFFLNGFYFVENSYIKKVHFYNCFRITNFKKVRINFGFKKFYKLKESRFIEGTKKFCLFLEDTQNVLNIFYSKKFYKSAKQNIKTYLATLPYPHISILEFNDNGHYYLSAKATRNIVVNSFTYRKVFENFVKIQYKDYFVKNNVLFLTQHGDFNVNNIFLIDDNRFLLIDLDDVGLRPAFFDLFYFFVFNDFPLTERDFFEINQYIERTLICCNASLKSDNFFDFYFRQFLFIFFKPDSEYFGLFSKVKNWVNCLPKENKTAALKVLNNLKGKC